MAEALYQTVTERSHVSPHQGLQGDLRIRTGKAGIGRWVSAPSSMPSLLETASISAQGWGKGIGKDAVQCGGYGRLV
jgi:hypothetical protein